jgi:hypothetical protein
MAATPIMSATVMESPMPHGTQVLLTQEFNAFRGRMALCFKTKLNPMLMDSRARVSSNVS